MPKRVDPLAQRRSVAQAVFRLAGARGADAISMRDVAAEAGVSLGMVQHYFRSKDEVLLFALGHMRDRVAAAAGPSRGPGGSRAARDHPRRTHRAPACQPGQQGRGGHLRRVLLPGGRHSRLRDRSSDRHDEAAGHHYRAAAHSPGQRPYQTRPRSRPGSRIPVLAHPRPGRTASHRPLRTRGRPDTARPPSRPDIHLTGTSKRILREQSAQPLLPDSGPRGCSMSAYGPWPRGRPGPASARYPALRRRRWTG